ncbi:DUF1659 domain-containing protein [Bacillaceae bacterium]
MAVVSAPNYSRFTLEVQIGTETDGRPITMTKSYSRVKADAADQDVYDVANAIAGLMSVPLLAISRFDSEELIDSAS